MQNIFEYFHYAKLFTSKNSFRFPKSPRGQVLLATPTLQVKDLQLRKLK